MKAAITGATGCVGRNLVDVLLRNGWEVIVLHRKKSDLSKLRGCNVEFAEVDLLDINSVRQAITLGIDALYHVAANVSHWPLEAQEQWRDNVDTTRNLLTVSKEKNVGRFIFTSTGAAAKPAKKFGIHSGYIASKKAAEILVEKAVKEDDLDAVILRLPIVIGKYDYNNYSRIFQELKHGSFHFSFPGLLIFANAEDIAKGHIQAFENAEKGECYYLGGEQTSWHDAFTRISKLVSCKKPPKLLPTWVYFTIAFPMLWLSYLTRKEPLLTPELICLINGQPDDPDIIAFNNGKAKAEAIGYQSSSLDNALSDCHEWLISENYL